MLALLVLSATVVGLPWVLIMMVGNPLPSYVTGQRITEILTRPDDGSIVIGLITIIAWVTWLIFVVAVVAELITMVSRQRIRIRLPGFGVPQRAAGALVVLVAAMIMTGPQMATAEPVAPHGPAVAAPASPSKNPSLPSSRSSANYPSSSAAAARDAAWRSMTGRPTNTGDDQHDRARERDTKPAAASDDHGQDRVTHTVQRGDDLWSLAEQYYGHGSQWRKISAANPDVLTGGPDRLRPGSELTIPTANSSRHVRVRGGDSLSAIAERAYGDPGAWHRIFEANRNLIPHPDRIVAGQLLRIPESGDQGTEHANERRHAKRPESNKSSAHPSSSPSPSDTGTREGTDERKSDTSVAKHGAGRGGPTPGPAAPEQTSSDSSQRGAGRAGDAMPIEHVHGRAQQTTHPANDAQVWFGGITGLLAAGVITALAARRRLQLRYRPVGRRIPQPATSAQQLEARLGRGQALDGLQLVDRALRAIGAHAVRTGSNAPIVVGGRVDGTGLELIMTDADLLAPAGVTVAGKRWRLLADDLAKLEDAVAPNSGKRLTDAPQPYPVLIPIGIDAQDGQLLLNLEHAGLLSIDGSAVDHSHKIDSEHGSTSRLVAADLLAAMINSISFSPWATEVELTFVGDGDQWSAAIDEYNVTAIDDLDQLLDQWQRRTTKQRTQLQDQPHASATQLRLDPDTGEAWSPQVALIGVRPSAEQNTRLQRLLARQPSPALAAVVIDSQDPCQWRLQCGHTSSERPGVVAEADEPTHDTGSTTADRDVESHGVLDEHRAATVSAHAASPEIVLEPLGWQLVPQRISGPLAEQLQGLLTATGSIESTPAPWWATDFPVDAQPARARLDTAPAELRTTGPAHAEQSDENADGCVRTGGDISQRGSGAGPLRSWPSAAAQVTCPVERDDSPADDITWITSHAARRPDPPLSSRNGSVDQLGAGESTSVRTERASEEPDTVSNPIARSDSVPSHPTLRVLGPIELVGGGGAPPVRAARQCVEYCAWLLEHPGSTAQAMASGLVVAEGTRRSNMSRLRSWLGSDDQDEPYLPDAYSGRITLSPLVSSDWHRLQLLCASGVNRTSTNGLCQALELVRGAPLADAAPGQWHWAEEMRTDMISVLRDIGIELTERALDDSDIDLARWAAARALTAAGQDELLMAARIRTEHLAGNPAEVERLSLQVSAQSRALGLDLDPETVDLLQQVLEGGLRARA